MAILRASAALAAFLGIAQASVTLKPATNFDADFNEYLVKYNKYYSSPFELARRKEIFQRNMETIQMLNQNAADNGEDVVYTVNHLADVDPSEILMPERPWLGENHDPSFPEEKYIAPLPTDNLPENFDWREKGAVTDVQNQGLIGSCWAFSAAQTIEGAVFMKHGELRQISVEHIVECDPNDCGAFGGWPHQAYEWVKKNGGVRAADDVPYCAGTGYGEKGACQPCMAPKYNQTFCGDHSDLFCDHKRDICSSFDPKTQAAAKVIDWHVVRDDEDQVRAALVKYGPLSIALNASWLQFYFKGIFNPPFCSDQLNHAVLLVGYGTDPTPTLMHPGGRKYWIIKNSWGKTWGEDGYVRLLRGGLKSKCGVRTDVTFVEVE